MVDKYILVSASSGARKVIPVRFVTEAVEVQGRTTLKTVDGSTYTMSVDLDSYMQFLIGGLPMLDAS